MLFSVIHWLESNQLPCFYKKFLGIPCPGCGMQSAFIKLLKGDLIGSVYTYPALIPMILLIIFLILHLIFRFEKGGIYLKYFFIFTVSIVIVHFIFRFI